MHSFDSYQFFNKNIFIFLFQIPLSNPDKNIYNVDSHPCHVKLKCLAPPFQPLRIPRVKEREREIRETIGKNRGRREMEEKIGCV